MDMETKITEMLISLFLVCIIFTPFIIIGLLIGNINKSKQIKEYQVQINELKFKEDYIDYVWQDNIRQ